APPERASIASPADSMRKRDARGAEGSRNLPTEQSSWSPAVASVEALLTASGCPLCREEEAAAATYLRWLSQELSERTPSQVVDDAHWLCRSHLWCFICIGEDKAVGELLRSAYECWAGTV